MGLECHPATKQIRPILQHTRPTWSRQSQDWLNHSTWRRR